MNFTISELLHSDKANNLGIVNTTSDKIVLDNIFYLICECLQPIRDKIAKPMQVTSGYRCPLLNRAVGGSQTSQHSKGQACDFVITGMSVSDIVNFIRNNGFKFDQLIEEHGKDGCWVHISYVHGRNRQEVLRFYNNKYTRI